MNFDGQNLLVWKYASEKGLMLYKDLFYPYGFLSYWASSSTAWAVISSLFTIILFFRLLYWCKYIFKSDNYAYIVILFFCGFVLLTNSVSSFARYGMFVVYSLLAASLYLQNKFSFKVVFILGLISGALFFLANDQGTYIIFFTFLFILSAPGIKTNLIHQKRNIFVLSIKRCFMYSIGLLTGSAPFIGYLISKNSLIDFVIQYKNLALISEYAKTPYFHSLRSLEGQFNIAVLFMSIFYLSFRFFFISKIFSKKAFFILVLTSVLLILEQKSIIRSIDNQLNFISILLCAVLVSFFLEKVSVLRQKSVSSKAAIVLSLLLIFFIPFYSHAGKMSGINNSPQISATLLAKNLLRGDTAYFSAIKRIKQEKDFNGKIFSFPGDPIFYILFNQNPPYYFTTYEATSEYHQKKNIEYIEKKGINYIIYNTKIEGIQDGVPEYVRSNLLLKYILQNFEVTDKVDSFFILRKSSGKDIFKNTFFLKNMSFKSYLTHIDLGNIPKTEGLYKEKHFKKVMIVVQNKTEKDLNEYFRKNQIFSSNKVLVYTLEKDEQKISVINIKTKDGLSTKIYFNTCDKNKACILHFSRIPLFFKNRILGQIQVSGSEEKLTLLEDKIEQLW